MNYKVDYHIHTHYSDGTMSPVEVVRQYNDEEYDIISITDHDGIDGLNEAMIAGEALKIQVVAGVELSTEQDGIELHILGYNFDPENEALRAKLKELREFRHERNKALIEKLTELGYPVNLEELEKQSKGKYVGKPNIARALVKAGYIAAVSDAWTPGKLFNAPEVKGIRKEKMKTEDAIKLLQQAGGMAVLAHPGKIKGLGERDSEEYWNNLDQLIRTLKNAGLKGMECVYPSHTEEEKWKFVQLASKYHLHVTEGSDFHGDRRG